MNLKQFKSILLFLIFTSTVVNVHALSHLLDSDTTTTEICSTCDDFTPSIDDEIFIISDPTFDFTLSPLFSLKTSKSLTQPEIFVSSFYSGQYHNKPPPSLN